MYVEWPTALKLARTPAQLFALVAIRAIVESDAVTPQMAAFGIGNLDQIDAVSLDTGDDAPGLVRLDAAAGDPRFEVLASAWLSVANDSAGGY